MKSWYRIGILLAVSALLPGAALADSDWYVAGYLGQSQLAGGGGLAQSWMDRAQEGAAIIHAPIPNSYEDAKFINQLTVGYSLNWYWGIEAGTINLGAPDAVGRNSINVPLPPILAACGAPCAENYDIETNASMKVSGWTVVLNGTYPISYDNSWAVFGRAGFIDSHVTLDITNTVLDFSQFGDPGAPGNLSGSSSGWKPTYGLGIKVSFDRNWSMRLVVDKYPRLGNSSTGTFSLTTTMVGLVYRF